MENLQTVILLFPAADPVPSCMEQCGAEDRSQNITHDHSPVRQKGKQIPKSELSHVVMRVNIKHIDNVKPVKAEVKYLGKYAAGCIDPGSTQKASDA
jgi:hypothetical protein